MIGKVLMVATLASFMLTVSTYSHPRSKNLRPTSNPRKCSRLRVK